MGTRHFSLSTVLISAALIFGAHAASGQSAPPLGASLPQFGVLGGAGVTGSTGLGTSVVGDVGSSPTPSILNFLGSTIPGPSRAVPPFIVHYTNDSVVQQAHLDAIAAYNDIGIQAASPSAVTIGPELSGLTLTSGIYNFAAAANLASPGGVVTGTLTLNGPGIFIFNVGSALTANVGSIVTGTANPCNVFWRIRDESATLNGVNFFGTVIANQSITVSSATTLTGRAIAINGAVTMPGGGGNTIGGCSSAIGPPPGSQQASGGSTLDSVGMAILLGLLAFAGVFAVNRFSL